ncbi:hypothetical protein B0H66DRAFT_530382 [Apodospora peruviana]|uniref:Uncharacterized protein n=1 Tax=Apodospora peruviana TaxID=516989 RepID=A0AAE0MBR9_9PEZI|nr:hypothetical protein B0H66DRAFT_530382 [Apodospora peruviana]
MPSFTITEPHPTITKNAYTHSGRGGAGNFFRAPATTAPSGVPTKISAAPAPSSSTGRFYSGRGGAGNAHAAAERRPVLSFDEELQRAEVRAKTATMSHVGRGGAGNVVVSGDAASTTSSKARRDSNSTDGESVRSGSFWRRLSHVGSH